MPEIFVMHLVNTNTRHSQVAMAYTDRETAYRKRDEIEKTWGDASYVFLKAVPLYGKDGD